MPQKDKPQHRRLTFIDQQISTGGYPICFRMSQEWEVSPKTIQRDVDYLRDELGAPIQFSALRHGFFYTEPTWRLPAIQLSEGEPAPASRSRGSRRLPRRSLTAKLVDQ
jgi:predicted DNA-binding transcriptional regulator YafY